jgi:hypothetical protein
LRPVRHCRFTRRDREHSPRYFDPCRTTEPPARAARPPNPPFPPPREFFALEFPTFRFFKTWVLRTRTPQKHPATRPRVSHAKRAHSLRFLRFSPPRLFSEPRFPPPESGRKPFPPSPANHLQHGAQQTPVVRRVQLHPGFLPHAPQRTRNGLPFPAEARCIPDGPSSRPLVRLRGAGDLLVPLSVCHSRLSNSLIRAWVLMGNGLRSSVRFSRCLPRAVRRTENLSGADGRAVKCGHERSLFVRSLWTRSFRTAFRCRCHCSRSSAARWRVT